MTRPQALRVVEAWIREQRALSRRSFIRYIQIFENKGEMMGCSNRHPHCQVWAQASVPTLAAQELACQVRYREQTSRCLLCDYLGLELREKDRIICDNEDFAAVVPFWAVWPFEALLLSKKHHASLTGLAARERHSLASLLLSLTVRYDNLFQISFPYSMGWHQIPAGGKEHTAVHLHAHFYPPLLRSATVRKFMVGYEMLAEPQRDVAPESSAARLRDQSDVRFE
jgi:UDPglucose--hexose-1-phosphate uridylyltransferase